MHLFYQPELKNGLSELTEEEAHHAIKVLRLKVSDLVEITDGKGTRAKAVISDIRKRQCFFEVTDQFSEPPPVLPSIAIAPTKNLDRFEWFLEKAVEIGVQEICPILSSNSERRVLKSERAEKIILAAMKQCQRNWLPKFHPLTSLSEFVSNTKEPLLIAHCRSGKKVHLNNSMNSKSWILIGPEGDFTKEEIEMVTSKGAYEIDLGASRLRTETAGIFALSVMIFLKG
jgi:16S rRNA (uracil1498-N3)-methyltransferase